MDASNRKCRSAIRVCEEGLACKTDGNGPPTATFHCTQCSADLCVECDRELHKLAQHRNHDRVQLEPPPSTHLCMPSQGDCKKRNFANVRCRECNASLCYDCDARTHQRGVEWRRHIRSSFDDYLASLKVNDQRGSLRPLRPPNEHSTGDDSRSTQAHKSAANDQKGKTTETSDVHRALSNAFRSEKVQPSPVTSAYIVNGSVPTEAFSGDEFYSFEKSNGARQTTSHQPLPAASTDHRTKVNDMSKAGEPTGGRYVMNKLEDALEDDPGLSPTRSTQRRTTDGMEKNRQAANGMTVVNLTDVELASRSVQLLDANEVFQPSDCPAFCAELGLGCTPQTRVKVVSIVGNTGDGKSFTLNRTFFPEAPVFTESDSQRSCTIGVCAALCPASANWLGHSSHSQAENAEIGDRMSILVVDTEGLLGVGGNPLQRSRMLLKVMAISDVIIYRSRAERLHADTFAFLGDAGRSYSMHFARELDRVRASMCAAKQPATSAAAASRSATDVGALGPILVVFHETQHTEPLSSADEFRKCFTQLGRDVSDLAAFSTLDYIGVRGEPRSSASLSEQVGYIGSASSDSSVSVPIQRLSTALRKHVANDTVRKPRSIAEVWRMLDAVNNKFGNTLEPDGPPCVFPESYFACTVCCQACGVHCVQSLNHERGDATPSPTPHCAADPKCRYVKTLDNRVLLCRSCDLNKIRSVLVPQLATRTDGVLTGVIKYAMAGYTLECRNCGVVFREREYWYNNPDPIDSGRVIAETTHHWSDGSAHGSMSGPNVGRAIVDQFETASKTLGMIAGGPAQRIASYVPSLYAPSYWVANADITKCCVCAVEFTENDYKHHCRKCGQGVCASCSQNRMGVPERGWNELVRVCDRCFRGPQSDNEASNAVVNDAAASGREPSPDANSKSDTALRRVGETVEQALRGAQKTIVKTVQESVRPAYWKPDAECRACVICESEFGLKLSLHHCRKCGEGVCTACSPELREVPDRGWTYKVRVCNNCVTLIDAAGRPSK